VTSGPSIRAVPFDYLWPTGVATELLTDHQRRHLESIATVRLLPVRTVLFNAGAPADAIFMISRGVTKSYRELRSGKQRVMAFMFPSDLLGLAEGGHYVNSVQALTPATVYSIPVAVLKESFRRDFALQFNFLCKVTHELRQAQRQLISIGRRDASGKFATFLETLQRNTTLGTDAAPGNGARQIWLPMTRMDIANYLGLTHETLSRAASRLVRQGVLGFPDRHHVQILDSARLHKLADPL